MQDKFLYKAKRKDNGKWVEGFIFNLKETERYFVFTGEFDVTELYPNFVRYEVEKDSICQCTGLKDANKKNIYKSDILRLEITDKLLKTMFSNSNLGKAVKEENVTSVILYIHSEAVDINLKYEVYFEINGKLDLRENGEPVVKAIGEDSMFPRYLIKNGAVIIGNIFDNPELLEVKS